MPTDLTVAILAIAFVLMLTVHIILIRWGLMTGRCWFIAEGITGEGETQTQETRTGLLPGDVEKLPFYNYKNGGCEETESGTAVCAVCIESFCIGDKCRLLPQCKHSFHADCVDSWLMKCALCPICRRAVELTTKDETLPMGQEVVIGIPDGSPSGPL